MDEIEDIRQAVDAGRLDEARLLLESALRVGASVVGRARACAPLAEALGLGDVAVRAWQLALKEDSSDAVAWEALGALHAERGELERAAACRARVHPDTVAIGAPRSAAPPEALSDAQLVRLAHLFGGRPGHHARMWTDGKGGVGYSPVQGSVSPAVWRAHLAGEVTAGVYLVEPDDTTRLIVLDFDASRQARERASGDRHRVAALREAVHAASAAVRDHLLARGLEPLWVDSGYKGRHLWLRLDPGLAAGEARRRVHALLASSPPLPPDVSLEVFPKQDQVRPGGLGNLVKLPQGVHLRTGRRAAVLDTRGEPHDDPVAAMCGLAASELPNLPTLVVPPATVAAAHDKPSPNYTTHAAQALPAPGFSEAEFTTSHELSQVLGGCAALRKLVSDVQRKHQVSRDESVTLNHTLGHLADGVRAVNFLYDKVPSFPAEERMGAPHRGSPMSCARIRQRVPGVTSTVKCDCRFAEAPGAYPNPLRHLDGALKRDARPKRSVDEVWRAYRETKRRLTSLEADEAMLRRELVLRLGGLPDERWTTPEGDVWLSRDEGLAVLRWAHEEDGWG